MTGTYFTLTAEVEDIEKVKRQRDRLVVLRDELADEDTRDSINGVVDLLTEMLNNLETGVISENTGVFVLR